jgi:hypothetical protein
MPNVTFEVRRPWTKDYGNEDGRRRMHEERARLLHSVVDAVDIEVIDWGETDDVQPHEVVEIIAVLGSAGVFTALVQVFRSWIERKKMEDVTVQTRAGDKISIARATPEDVERIIRSLRLPKRPRTS